MREEKLLRSEFDYLYYTKDCRSNYNYYLEIPELLGHSLQKLAEIRNITKYLLIKMLL